MSAGWVAAATRSRALVRHLAGPRTAAAIARADWPTARRLLAGTVHGRDLPVDADRETARRMAMAATVWHLRVLAGWFPPGQGSLARLFAAPFELANIEGHVAALATPDGPAETPLPLGSMAVAWPRVAAVGSLDAIRPALAASVWGDPGGTGRAELALGLRLGLADRLRSPGPPTDRWAAGGAAVLVARERFGFGRDLDDRAGRVADRILGPRWRRCDSLPVLVRSLPRPAAWALAGIDDPADLWRAEVQLARTVAREAEALVAAGRDRRAATIGAMTLLLVDLRRVVAATDLAGMGPGTAEVLDAVA